MSQPAGEVTLVFSDIEGSTRLLEELGIDAYRHALNEHRRIVRDAYARYSGYEVDYEGDAFFYTFSSAPDAICAVTEAMAGLEPGPINIRVGIHTGSPEPDPPKYVGMDVHTAARIMSTGHGGQVVVSPTTAALVDVTLKELGEHRLKDIEQAVPLFQLGDGSFPPLKTISNTNLPRPASPFLGRETELAEVLSWIKKDARLVTLTGPGGSGKTRLAIEAASAVVTNYKAGVFWVGLASLRDPALVIETIAQTLGVKDGLAEHIGERELLLLLDNLEQVVEAAPDLSALLRACANLTLLVTSRELLRIQGEVEYAVPPLAEREAVALFCERARLEPTHEIAELCARLDNLPLAVELAAARTKGLSVAQILQRISQRLDLLKGGRDADPRQLTLRATIEWSYKLLSLDEQQLFARLGVFVGGCTLEAAEKVVDAELDTLQSLVEKSLLRFSLGRYWMLETIREHATELLNASGEAEKFSQQHAEHFQALADAAGPHLQSDPEEWLDRLEPEHDNFRAALDRLETSGESQRALRLAGALANFWDAGGYIKEGQQRLESLLQGDERPTDARAKALVGAALIARLSGDAATTRLHAEEARVLYRALDDPRGAALSGVMLGLGHADAADFPTAMQLFADSVELFRQAGDDENALFATRLLGWMYEELGDFEFARKVHEDNLRQARALTNKQFEGQSLGALASLAIEDGTTEEALSMLREVLRIDRDRGAPIQTALDLVRFARALAFVDDRQAEAARFLSCAQAIREETGAGTLPYLSKIIEDTLARIHMQLDVAAFAAAWEQGRTLTADEAVALALDSLD